MQADNEPLAIKQEINSENLYLRPLAETDAEGMFAMLGDAQTVKYWSNEPARDLEEARKKLADDMHSDAQGNSISWAVSKKNTDKMIGRCVLFHQ